MQNYIQEGRILNLAFAADTEPGEVVVVGSIIGVAVAGGPADTLGAVQVVGVFDLPKKSTDTFDVGDKLWWDTVNGYSTTGMPSGGIAFGVSLAVVTSGVTTAPVRLNGSF